MNPTYDDLFGSKYLKTDDLEPEGITVVTIKATEFTPIGPDKEMKLTLSFKELDKALVVNVTNARSISELYTKKIDTWPGKRLALYVQEVNFAGKPVNAVRIKPRIPKAAEPETRTPDDY